MRRASSKIETPAASASVANVCRRQYGPRRSISAAPSAGYHSRVRHVSSPMWPPSAAGKRVSPRASALAPRAPRPRERLAARVSASGAFSGTALARRSRTSAARSAQCSCGRRRDARARATPRVAIRSRRRRPRSARMPCRARLRERRPAPARTVGAPPCAAADCGRPRPPGFGRSSPTGRRRRASAEAPTSIDSASSPECRRATSRRRRQRPRARGASTCRIARGSGQDAPRVFVSSTRRQSFRAARGTGRRTRRT